MRKKQTPLQKLIEWLEEVNAPSGIIKSAQSLLAEEEAMVVSVFNTGNDNLLADKWFPNGEEYFKETYIKEEAKTGTVKSNLPKMCRDKNRKGDDACVFPLGTCELCKNNH